MTTIESYISLKESHMEPLWFWAYEKWQDWHPANQAAGWWSGFDGVMHSMDEPRPLLRPAESFPDDDYDW